MTVYLKEQIDELRDLLEDPTDSQVTFLRKLAFINAGARAMWPRVYRVVEDKTDQFESAVYEYALPTTVQGGRMISVEKSTALDDDFFYMMDFDDYEFKRMAGGADLLILKFKPGSTWADGYIRWV